MKSFFYYGTMNSSKTAQLLMTRHNYLSNGDHVCLLKPSTDTREGKSNEIGSRIGLKATADKVIEPLNLFDDGFEEQLQSVLDYVKDHDVSAVLLDEAQFFTPNFIVQLNLRLAKIDIAIMAYGLLKDYQGYLFEGSKAWIEMCDCIREIKTTCSMCHRKATFNFRESDSKDLIEIGDSGYLPLCRKHYTEKVFLV